jgi:transposase InsO family protein
MPWKESHCVEKRFELINRYAKGERISDLCEEFGVSRKTGYKFLSRYRSLGQLGLQDQSRRPKTTPHAVEERIRESIISVRKQYPTWGARKIKAMLQREYKNLLWPSPSIIHLILAKQGLVEHKRTRKKRIRSDYDGFEPSQPNQLWSADFKGQFELKNKQVCYPLTITDNYSRYIIACQGLPRTTYELSKPVFEQAFELHGIPEVIKTDNGSPFASTSALAGLSQLSAWWVTLGIKIQRIQPGKPQQNGRHERMHRTLKAEAARPAAGSMLAQQSQFDSFVDTYNYVRPHEALNMKTPGEYYTKSHRIYQKSNLNLAYNLHDFTRIVAQHGDVSFMKERFFLSEALRGYTVGITEVDDDLWKVSFAHLDLGVYDSQKHEFTEAQKIG